MFEFKGYKYQPWEDVEEDNIKIFHDVLTPEGNTISMPISPYSRPSEIQFQKWVLLGCPTQSKIITRPDGHQIICNWDLKDIDSSFAKQF